MSIPRINWRSLTGVAMKLAGALGVTQGAISTPIAIALIVAGAAVTIGEAVAQKL